MVPKLFRVALQVADLDQAATFYAKLLADPGIRIPRGSRHYFDCGPVILALVDVAKGAGESPQSVGTGSGSDRDRRASLATAIISKSYPIKRLRVSAARQIRSLPLSVLTLVI